MSTPIRILSPSKAAPPLQGTLFKQSDHLKIWNQRYFRLDGRRLLYWLSEHDAHGRPKGLWRLSDNCVSERVIFDQDAHMWTFNVLVRANDVLEGRSYLLGAEKRETCDKWRAALQAASSTVVAESRIVQSENDEFDERFQRLPSDAKALYTASQPNAVGWQQIASQTWSGTAISVSETPYHLKTSAFCSRIGVAAIFLSLLAVSRLQPLLLFSAIGDEFLMLTCSYIITRIISRKLSASNDVGGRLRRLYSGIALALLVSVSVGHFLFSSLISSLLAASYSTVFILMYLDESLALYLLDNFIDVCRADKMSISLNHPPELVARVLASYQQRRHWDINLALTSSHISSDGVMGRMLFCAAIPELVSPRELNLAQSTHYLGRSTFVITEHSVSPVGSSKSDASPTTSSSWFQRQIRAPKLASFRGGFVVTSSNAANGAELGSTVTLVSQRQWNAFPFLSYLVSRMVPMREVIALRSFEQFLASAPPSMMSEIEKEFDVPSVRPSPGVASQGTSHQAQYLALADQAALRIIEYARGTSADGWQQFDQRDGVTFSQRPFPPLGPDDNATNALRGIGTLPFSAATVVELISDVTRRTNFDAMYDFGHEVERIDDYASIHFSSFKMPWPVSARDFCSITLRARTQDGAWIIAVTSVEHPKCPPRDGSVRGHIVVGGYLIQPETADSCTIHYVSHSDPKGSLPTSVVKAASTKQPEIVCNLRKHLVQNRSEVASHAAAAESLKRLFEGPDAPLVHINSRSAGSVVNATITRSNSTPAAVASPVVEPGSVSHSTPTPPTVALSPRAVGHLESADRALFSLIELSNLPESAWESVSESHDVAVSRRHMPHSDLYCIRGVGTIDASAADIMDLLTKPERRMWYDELCTQADCVDQLDSNTVLAYTRFEARGWLCAASSQREFLMVHKQTRLHDGAYVLAGCSVSDSRAPTNQNCVRGEVMLGGWVIRPSLRKSDRSLVSYYMHVDLGGSVPAWAANIVAEKQPLCIDQIRKLLTSQ